jgi:hypothetical protein
MINRYRIYFAAAEKMELENVCVNLWGGEKW